MSLVSAAHSAPTPTQNRRATKSRIFFTGTFQFPDGAASAARVLGIGKALRKAGHECLFMGLGSGRRADLDGVAYIHHGFRYWPRATRSDLWGRTAALWDLFVTCNSFIDRLQLAGFGRGDALIVYQHSAVSILRMAALCRAVGAGLIVDTVEWYDSGHILGGRFGPVGIDHSIRMRVVAPKVKHHIAISSFLRDHFADAGCTVVRVPPLIDLDDTKWTTSNQVADAEGLKLVYGGTPGRKDLLGTVIESLVELRNHGREIELTILGPRRGDLQPYLPAGFDLDSASWLNTPGRVEQDRVPSILAQHDYSVLIRPRKRYAQAGFPTKVVESLAAGVPVITNHTSDLADHIRDGETGWVCDDFTPRALMAAIERALRADAEQRARMRSAARAEALRAFSYTAHANTLSSLVDQAVKYAGA